MGSGLLQKTCTRCGETKPTEAFYASRYGQHGRTPYCRKCIKAQNAERRCALRGRTREEIFAVQPAKKQCSRCLKAKPKSAFTFNRVSVDGLSWVCRTCNHQEQREHTARRSARTVADVLASQPQSKRCPECDRVLAKSNFSTSRARPDGLYQYCRECGSAQYKQSYRKHKHRWKAAYRRWCVANAERCREYQRISYRRHPEKAAEKRNRRRARQEGLAATYTSQDWMRSLEVFSRCCAYCGKHESVVGAFDQDHVIPVVAGGGYVPGNIVPACAKCNGSKWQKPYAQWMQERGYDVKSFRERLVGLGAEGTQ